MAQSVTNETTWKYLPQHSILCLLMCSLCRISCKITAFITPNVLRRWANNFVFKYIVYLPNVTILTSDVLLLCWIWNTVHCGQQQTTDNSVNWSEKLLRFLDFWKCKFAKVLNFEKLTIILFTGKPLVNSTVQNTNILATLLD